MRPDDEESSRLRQGFDVEVLRRQVERSEEPDDRPALAELLAAVREGQVSVAIVCKRDCLARDQAFAGHVETMIRRTGAELISITKQV